MVLAEPRCGITVVLEDPADRRAILADDRVVAWKARRQLGDDAKAHRVVVASGDQRRPRGRAQGGGVEFRVAQPRLGDAVQRRGRYDAAKGAADAISLVVGHDEQNVGRALGRHNGWRPPRLGILGVLLDHAAEFRVWRRDLIALDRGGGAGRTRGACDLLGHRLCRCHAAEREREYHHRSCEVVSLDHRFILPFARSSCGSTDKC